jgi:chromosomal replication initiation ATPase DnaA
MIEPITAEHMRRDYLYALWCSGGLVFSEDRGTSVMETACAKDMAWKFAKEAGIPPSDFFGTNRLRKVAWARQDCMRMLRDETNLSLPDIGRIFGRDHTTVLHGISASEKRANAKAFQA